MECLQILFKLDPSNGRSLLAFGVYQMRLWN